MMNKKYDLEDMMRTVTKGKKTFTAEDIRAAGLFDNLYSNAIGQIFRSLSLSGKIKMAGISKATRQSRRGGWMFKWEWVEEK